MIKKSGFHIDFIKNKSKYFAISLSAIILGIVLSFVFGVYVDIKFKGGAIISYSYDGDNITSEDIASIVKDSANLDSKVSLSSNLLKTEQNIGSKVAAIELAGNSTLDIESQKAITSSLNKNYADSNFTMIESNSVDPSNGHSFFLKCMCAIAMASMLMVMYIAFRFRKIGGWSAGVMAVVALLHDAFMVYLTFVLFRMPIDDNFIAVVLTIVGYSINDTIIIYDRIRENRRLMGPRVSVSDLVNISTNQTLRRTINTSITTLLAILSALTFAIIFNISSVITFTIPMAIGVVSGCYSTICIAGPLWVMWQNHSEAQKNLSTKSAVVSPVNTDPSVGNNTEDLNQESHQAIADFQDLDLSKRGTGKSKASKREREKFRHLKK